MNIKGGRLKLKRWRLIGLAMILLTSSISFAQRTEWSAEDKAIWNKAVKRVVTTPPCCGACAVLRMDDAKKIYGFVTRDAVTPEGAELFERHKKTILDAVKFFDKDRYGAWEKLFIKKGDKQ